MAATPFRPVSLSIRIAWMLVCLAYFWTWYFFSIHVGYFGGQFNTLAFDFEKYIPFVPWTFFIYTSIYITPVLVFMLLNSREELKNLILSFFMCVAIAKTIWLFYPVQYQMRPVDLSQYGLMSPLLIWLYTTDAHGLNCFPSLHVAFAFLFYFVIKSYAPSYAKWFLFHALLVAISTLTLKQHYLADIIAGYCLAWLTWDLCIKYRLADRI